jgi:DNA-binding response OmpR family regulator
MKVLVVDDDTAVRESVSKVLREEGYETVVAADGRVALQHFAAQPIDLLVLDLGLPYQTGWEVLAQVARKNPRLPVVIITGQSDQFQTAQAAGARALLEKPLDVAELLHMIKELLAKPKETRLQRVSHGEELRRFPARKK